MSNGSDREELMQALATLAELCPEMRIGQLLAAVGELCGDLHGRGLWEAENRELLEAAWKFQRDLRNNCVRPGQLP